MSKIHVVVIRLKNTIPMFSCIVYYSGENKGGDAKKKSIKEKVRTCGYRAACISKTIKRRAVAMIR